jgi:RNA polymerase sigma factor (TIGR02999 family)
MTERENGEIASLLAAVEAGESGAVEQLVESVYPELKRLAHFQLMGERAGHTLNTTAIVHEAFMRLCSGDSSWRDRGHFLRAAATVMRHVLIDYARKRHAEKRGDGIAPITLHDDRISSADDSEAVLALDEAVRKIASADPRLEQIIECRYFAGLSVDDTAQALGLAVRTVERDIKRAKAYLMTAMDSQ